MTTALNPYTGRHDDPLPTTATEAMHAFTYAYGYINATFKLSDVEVETLNEIAGLFRIFAEVERLHPTPQTGKTHCDRGHEYTPENTRISVRGARICRACRPIRQALRRAKGRS